VRRTAPEFLPDSASNGVSAICDHRKLIAVATTATNIKGMVAGPKVTVPAGL
jgi:hypothetical protein